MNRAGALFLVIGLAACAASMPPEPKPSKMAAAEPARPDACAVARVTTCDVAPPTYERDLRPVLERRCFSCHAGDGAAAEEHDWSRYAVAFAQRRAIADQIAECGMPPPKAPRPSKEEAELILRWVTCGAVER
jgi:hypothetical protein